MKDKYQLIWI